LQASTFNYVDPATVLGTMNLMSMSPTIGLRNNTLYDIISDNDGVGYTSVGALSFEVSCGTLQNMDASLVVAGTGPCSDAQYIQLEWKYQSYTCSFSSPPYSHNKVLGGMIGPGELKYKIHFNQSKEN
jgi:hypothetical protein